MEIRCRLCGKTFPEIGGYLHRVSKTGEIPVLWECRPSCDSKLTKEEALIAAIEGDKDEKV